MLLCQGAAKIGEEFLQDAEGGIAAHGDAEADGAGAGGTLTWGSQTRARNAPAATPPTWEMEKCRLVRSNGLNRFSAMLLSEEATRRDRSIRFYVDQLGFNLLFDSPVGIGRFVVVGPPDGSAMICLAPMPPGSDQTISRTAPIVFLTENVAAKYEEWSARGVLASRRSRCLTISSADSLTI